MAQQYSLRWNNHQPNFISQFTSLLNTQTLVDVTLCADGVQLLAHKVVLSACSSYFQTLFVDHPASHPIVILKDVTYTDLRTLVDFMYCGQINVTEEELPQVLATAKLLKIKGLHEMPDSTCLLRSHAPVTEFQHQGDSVDSVRDSPATSPSSRRRRRRRSSAGSTQLNVVESVDTDHGRADVAAQTVEAITLSSVSSACSSGPTQRRPREYNQIRTIDNSQQVDDTTEPETMNVDTIGIDTSSPITLSSGGQWTMMEHSYPRYTNACIGAGALQQDPGMYINNVINNPQMDADLNYTQGLGVAASASQSSADGWRRRSKHFKRQKRVRDELSIRKQTSEPIPSTATRSESPSLEIITIEPATNSKRVRDELSIRKQTSEPIPSTAAGSESPPLEPAANKPKSAELPHQARLTNHFSSMMMKGVVVERQASTSSCPTFTTNWGSLDSSSGDASSQKPRASHTPTIRTGPPLSCNFCWNTVDECGRILRRKTQYHCPECRTNLCIVPCFHEYHDGPESDNNANAR